MTTRPRRKPKTDIATRDPSQEIAGEVVVCAGPPDCLIEGDEAVQNQIDGCPMCRRIIIGADGTETEYRAQAN